MKERIAVGRLVGVFGIKGWLKVKSNTQPAENIVNYAPWYLKTPLGLKELIVDDYAFRPQGLVVHVKGCDNRDEAIALGKADIEVVLEQLPALSDGDYYWHQLIGLSVFTCFGNERKLLGKIKEMLETGANDVIVVAACDGSIDEQERLIPYVPGEFVKQISLSGGEIEVDWDPDF
jgi:16S rRNA processing protein RimM